MSSLTDAPAVMGVNLLPSQAGELPRRTEQEVVDILKPGSYTIKTPGGPDVLVAMDGLSRAEIERAATAAGGAQSPLFAQKVAEIRANRDAMASRPFATAHSPQYQASAVTMPAPSLQPQQAVMTQMPQPQVQLQPVYQQVPQPMPVPMVGIPFLDAGMVTAPGMPVQFETSLGSIEAYYHHVSIAGQFVVLIYDSRHQGMQFFPKPSDQPFRTNFPQLQRSCLVIAPDCRFSLGALEVCLLGIVPESSPDLGVPQTPASLDRIQDRSLGQLF